MAVTPNIEDFRIPFRTKITQGKQTQHISGSRFRCRRLASDHLKIIAKSCQLTTFAAGFGVHYVAENHENLHHILVFLNVTGVTPGAVVEAEVLASSADGERLIIKNGLHVSDPLSLPGRATPGKTEVKVQSGHYEVKLASPSSSLTTGSDSTPLLDASQLSTANPTSFICASCSLPLVQSSGIDNYRDLPSEHWEELVDAWMCHADQTLHSQVARHGQGFWPEPGQALVGGSYILFEESSVVKIHFCPEEQSKVRNPLYRFFGFRTIKKTGVGLLPTVECSVNSPSFL